MGGSTHTHTHTHTGHLAFLRWTPEDSMMPLPAFTDKKFTHLIYDQILIYNHAALSYLDTNTYLFFAGACGNAHM